MNFIQDKMESDTTVDKILTVREVADYLKVSRTTIWRWCSQGKLSAFKAGHHWRIHRAEIEKLEGQKVVPLLPIEIENEQDDEI